MQRIGITGSNGTIGSKNGRRVFDLTETMAQLGTDPQHNAGTFFQG